MKHTLLIVFCLLISFYSKGQFGIPGSGISYSMDMIGIGLSNPQSHFHVSNGPYFTHGLPANALIWIGGGNDLFDKQYINFRNPSKSDANAMYWWSSDIIFGRNKNKTNWSFKETHGDGLGSAIKDIIAAYITDGGGYSHLQKVIIAPNGGNVGVGIENPTHKFEVNGIVRAKEIKVEATNWPDYVFERDYELMSLDEVKSFIDQKGHLPGFKSEKEYSEEGVNLLELNQKLLEKVEEITLYLLHQQKAIEAQSQLIEKQQRELDFLLAKKATIY
ncbi:hypothetical protein [Anditalea andensis]|uniref:Peptidase S74 domain-containing protein n=1 Tax=Anditalea andensis TaxID=1048983 RepID=A0A074LCY4_9BACT|nr:hypothetical protein [Anditalea andensis]KEO71617.1 hypothetical protein EL17_24025 [Anditalea andensis]